MQTSSSVSIGWKIVLLMGIYLIVISLVQIFSAEAMFSGEFEAFTGDSWSDYVANSAKPAELFLINQRIIGASMFIIGLLAALIAWKSYSRAEKWSWYALLMAGVLGWGTMLTYYIVISYLVSTTLVLWIIGVGLFVVGLALPAKAILGGKSAKE